MIQGQEGVRNAYRDEKVARDYVDRRFREPLGAMLHALQLRRMRAVIGTLQPKRVLEIAPGPARLTVDLATEFSQGVTLLDASQEMLAEARARLGTATHSIARLVQGDAFNLPFCGPFDLIYTFRLIRHFEDAERGRLYQGMARLLRPGGFLVFDAVNADLGRTVRRHPRSGCQHYDALLTPDRIASELDAAGLTLIRLDQVQRHYAALYWLQVFVAPRVRWLARTAMEIVGRIPGGQPLEWIVTCERR